MREQNHTCHAIGCKTKTKPEIFMCLKHWRMVPNNLQLMIWRYYRPGQCDDRRAFLEYCYTAKQAICEVGTLEGITVTGNEDELKPYDWIIGKPTD